MKPLELLLIEDSPGDILLIRQVLSREPFPISIHAAVDGKQATEILAAGQFKPDLLILDLSLPRLSGLSFLERTHPDAPVVVFTSSSNPQDRKRSLELGAKEFVQKPSDLHEYAGAVSRIVRNLASRSNPVSTN
jgi:CheY-like chemotaxis protein